MPSYTAPVAETRYRARGGARHRALLQPARLRECDARSGRGDPDEGGRFAAEVLAPLNRVGDEHGCTRHADGSVTTPPGFKEAYDQFVAGGWTTLSAPEEYGGQGLPHGRRHRGQRISALRQPGVRNVSRPDPGRDRRDAGQGHGRAEADLCPQHGRRQMDRDDEPDRAALRHRSRPPQDPRRSAGRTAATSSPAPRSSSPPASTISPRTSSTSSSPRSPARRTM